MVTPHPPNSITPSFTFLFLLLLATLSWATPLLTSGSNDGKQDHYHQRSSSSRRSSTYIFPDLRNASIHDLQTGLEGGHFSSVDLVNAYLQRIEETNDVLGAVLEIAPRHSLLQQARSLDAERALSGTRSPLHGLPVLLKDNIAIDSQYGMNTTAGSYTLLNSIVPRDAPLVSKLHTAGAVVIGKASMSVWAQFRGNLTQGWSPRGGYSSSAYLLGGNPCSSSSGSGIAASIGLAPIILGSETDGSINCPASRNGIVGVKPTIGLVSRFGVIPISSTQDTVGPMVRWVEDAATILTTIATPRSSPDGSPSLDTATADQPASIDQGGSGIDYGSDLAKMALHSQDQPLAGVRIGIVAGTFTNLTFNGFDQEVVDIYYQALETLQQGGATLVNVTFDVVENSTALTAAFTAELTVLYTELQQGLESYLSFLREVPSGTRSLGALIQFAIENPELELPVTEEGDESDQFSFTTSLLSPFYAPLQPGQSPVDDCNKRQFNATYAAALIAGKEVVSSSITRTLKDYKVDVVVGPADGFLYSLAAIAANPSMTVPSGFFSADSNVQPAVGTRPVWPFPGAPVGLSFIAEKWEEGIMLKVARGFEVMQQRLGRGGYDGVVRTLQTLTPTTQIQDVMQ